MCVCVWVCVSRDSAEHRDVCGGGDEFWETEDEETTTHPFLEIKRMEKYEDDKGIRNTDK